jgi:hypothetical protein
LDGETKKLIGLFAKRGPNDKSFYFQLLEKIMAQIRIDVAPQYGALSHNSASFSGAWSGGQDGRMGRAKMWRQALRSMNTDEPQTK